MLANMLTHFLTKFQYTHYVLSYLQNLCTPFNQKGMIDLCMCANNGDLNYTARCREFNRVSNTQTSSIGGSNYL